MRIGAALTALFLLVPLAAQAGTMEFVGTDVAVALPLLAGGLAVSKNDWTGVAELTVDTVATVGTVYGLKHVVREPRPDGSGNHSFRPTPPPLPSRRRNFCGIVMAGNMAFPPIWRPALSPTAASMPKNITGTMSPPAPAFPSPSENFLIPNIATTSSTIMSPLRPTASMRR